MCADALSDVVDRLAVRDLTARYNRAFDDLDVDAWLATFTTDGVMSLDGREWCGPDALRRLIDRIGFGMVHLTTDSVVTVDGDTAVQECSLLLLRRQRDRGPVSVVTSGRYTDLLVRTPDGWRFARRDATTDATL